MLSLLLSESELNYYFDFFKGSVVFVEIPSSFGVRKLNAVFLLTLISFEFV